MQNVQNGYVWMKENEMMKLYGDKVSGGSGNAMTKRSKIPPVHWKRDVKEFCFVFLLTSVEIMCIIILTNVEIRGERDDSGCIICFFIHECCDSCLDFDEKTH